MFLLFLSSAQVQRVAFNTQSKLEGITKNNPVTLNNLRLEVLEDVDSEDPEEEETLVRFVMAYQHTGEISTAGKPWYTGTPYAGLSLANQKG